MFFLGLIMMDGWKRNPCQAWQLTPMTNLTTTNAGSPLIELLIAYRGPPTFGIENRFLHMNRMLN